eukprot:6200073-Pleurochrysis_carterae.AAC.2
MHMQVDPEHTEANSCCFFFICVHPCAVRQVAGRAGQPSYACHPVAVWQILLHTYCSHGLDHKDDAAAFRKHASTHLTLCASVVGSCNTQATAIGLPDTLNSMICFTQDAGSDARCVLWSSRHSWTLLVAVIQLIMIKASEAH